MSTNDVPRATPVSLEDRIAIATPEGVEIELTLAGIGSRFIAGGIDFAIQLVVIVSAGLITRPAAGAGTAIFATATFLIIFFYDVLFEVLGGGKTPGKRWNGLRVVRSGGRPITLVRSALRNILRLIDILPGFYAVGMTVIFISPRNQRIGDLVAGTHVVRDRTGESRHQEKSRSSIDTSAAATWDVTAVSSEDIAAVRAYLDRRFDLNEEASGRIGEELASRLRPRVGGVPSDISNLRFLELLVAVKSQR